MDDPFFKYSNSTSPTQKQIDKADKEARTLAVKEKIAEEKAKKEQVAADTKLKADKQRHPEYYSDSDDDIGLLKQYQRMGEPDVKIDESYMAESSVKPPPVFRLFDDKLGPVYPSYIGKDGEVRPVVSVPAKNWLSSFDGGKRSKRRRKSKRRVATRKSKRGRVSKSKRGIKSKRTRS